MLRPPARPYAYDRTEELIHHHLTSILLQSSRTTKVSSPGHCTKKLLGWRLPAVTWACFATQDLQKGDARLFAKARKHYEALGDRLTAAGAALDVFACSLDQVGLAEMRPAVSDSGGTAE